MLVSQGTFLITLFEASQFRETIFLQLESVGRFNIQLRSVHLTPAIRKHLKIGFVLCLKLEKGDIRFSIVLGSYAARSHSHSFPWQWNICFLAMPIALIPTLTCYYYNSKCCKMVTWSSNHYKSISILKISDEINSILFYSKTGLFWTIRPQNSKARLGISDWYCHHRSDNCIMIPK